jgi:hypothetical protein
MITNENLADVEARSSDWVPGTPPFEAARRSMMDADGIQFNEFGQGVYTREVFRVLGGVIVGPSPLATEPASNNRRDSRYVP